MVPQLEQCKVVADPRFTTFDEYKFAFNGEGVYELLYKGSSGPNDPCETQVQSLECPAPCPGSLCGQSYMAAIGIRTRAAPTLRGEKPKGWREAKGAEYGRWEATCAARGAERAPAGNLPGPSRPREGIALRAKGRRPLRAVVWQTIPLLPPFSRAPVRSNSKCARSRDLRTAPRRWRRWLVGSALTRPSFSTDAWAR